MNIADIAAQRLHNQFLIENLTDPVEVVRRLGAVQAQDFVGAKWALGLRCQTTDETVTKLFNEGKILRTHMLRPTWHFVVPEDIRWIQMLTAPRVHQQSKYYYKKLGMDEPTVEKSQKVLASELRGGNQLTKAEIVKLFVGAGIVEVSGLRFLYLLMRAELDALICSGAMRGKQHTYALLEERAPQAKEMSREQALAEFAARYFKSRGPATVKDFMWWSSLTAVDAKNAVDLAKLKSEQAEDGQTYYFVKPAPTDIPSPIVHLLPNYDEYFISYKDRSAFSMTRTFKVLRKPGYEDLFYHLIALDGQLVGGWRREIKSKEFIVKLNMFVELNKTQNNALKAAAKRLSNFYNLPVAIN
jgi:hypothetical protein